METLSSPRIVSPINSPVESPSSVISFEERRSFIRNNISDEVRLFRRILNKITGDERTFEGYLETILKISVINPDADSTNDNETMKPVVSSFLSMIYEDKESNNNIVIYGKLFTHLVKRWSGRQGKVLMNVMINEINTFILNYLTLEISPEEMAENSNRRKCFCIIKFLHYLYYQDGDIIPGKIIMIIMEKFFSIKETHLEIFTRILTQNIEKLNKEKLFVAKLKDKYKKFLEENKASEFTSRQYNYMIEDTLKIF